MPEYQTKFEFRSKTWKGIGDSIKGLTIQVIPDFKQGPLPDSSTGYAVPYLLNYLDSAWLVIFRHTRYGRSLPPKITVPILDKEPPHLRVRLHELCVQVHFDKGYFSRIETHIGKQFLSAVQHAFGRRGTDTGDRALSLFAPRAHPAAIRVESEDFLHLWIRLT